MGLAPRPSQIFYDSLTHVKYIKIINDLEHETSDSKSGGGNIMLVRVRPGHQFKTAVAFGVTRHASSARSVNR
jgi:hypothetical protein